MRVVILAAGVGSRLMPLTRNTPKSLIDVGDGYTLLEKQLGSIGACGVQDVTIVTGYKSEQIEAKLADYSDFRITIAFNPFYELANNIVSAWLGLWAEKDDVVLVNGDDVFQHSVLATLLESPEHVTLMVSRKDSYDEDDMKVILEGDEIVDIGKDIPIHSCHGESIGMMLFRGVGLQLMRQYLQNLLREQDNFQLFYLTALRAMMSDGHRIAFRECDPDAWAEVDFHPDLETIRSQVIRDLPV